MTTCRQITPKGERFFALALYLGKEAQKKGVRLRVWRLIKAWQTAPIEELKIIIKTEE